MNESMDRIETLQEYVQTMIYKDIVERYNIAKIQPIKHMIRYLMNSPASLFSVNKFYNYLKSIQIKCRKDSLYDYIDYLHDTFFIFPVNIHTQSEKARKINPTKIYIVDTGIIQAHSKNNYPIWGHLLENFVFMELRRKKYLIEYYRTSKGNEVDFLTTDKISGKKTILQVSLNIDEEVTKNREIRGLHEAMSELKIENSWLITANHYEKITKNEYTINIMPAWLWALIED